ncbi:activator of 90 kDa heat shock protein ATPase homolog 1 [Agrilus planipennis]|uniref:Activator of 90 kDa heat shock protein ATPase homolog 1 n=1 Tax=Agrilus planipennis TaxID=224129 RepID=A0A1W4WAD1_AGRPL|nr:activator of 90 kDa heat shock protein ATPase homolog 1 [Agrilus planipennis]
MAKWGEGDPRWIVEERPDATNVNNWHWTEKNASNWSQERIKNLFTDATVTSDLADLKIKEVEKCEGEAYANNRKGKLIFFYEWNLVLKWEGKLKEGTGTKHKGKVTVPNLSEENDVSELDIQISVKDNEEEGEVLKEIMQSVGKEFVKEKLGNYITSLKEEFSKGMILPRKDEVVNKNDINNLSCGFDKKINMQSNASKKDSKKEVGLKIDTSTLKLTQKFQCRASEFYDAMTRIEMVSSFTRGPVKLEPVKGGKFELFGGNISGHFDKLEPPTKIQQQWRYKAWPEGHYSTVEITIDEKEDHTEVRLVQTGVPRGELEKIRENWERYYWTPIKQVFGFGAFITDSGF